MWGIRTHRDADAHRMTAPGPRMTAQTILDTAEQGGALLRCHPAS
jgi:hypothetical protein